MSLFPNEIFPGVPVGQSTPIILIAISNIFRVFVSFPPFTYGELNDFYTIPYGKNHNLFSLDNFKYVDLGIIGSLYIFVFYIVYSPVLTIDLKK